MNPLAFPAAQSRDRQGAVSASSAESLFDEARAHQQAGRYAQAEAAYQRYLKLHPAKAEVLANLGAVQVRLEKYPAAIANYQAALKLAPALNPIRLNLGLAYLKSGQREPALAQFSAALEREPGNVQIAELRAMTLLELERFEEAAAAYRALPAQSLSARIGLATALARMGKSEELRATLGPLLARENTAEVQFLLAQAHFADGQYDEAKAALDRAARLNPKLPALHFHLGAVAWKQQDTERALAEWRKELAAAPESFQANYTLGVALAMTGGAVADAERLLHKAIALRPKAAPALYQLARLKWQKERSPEATGLLERAVAADAAYREAHYLLGTIYQAQGRKAEAAREFAAVKRLSEAEVKRSSELFEIGK